MKDGRWTSQKSHSVLHCRSNVCVDKIVNRDTNASRNILELTVAAQNNVEWSALCSPDFRECRAALKAL